MIPWVNKMSQKFYPAVSRSKIKWGEAPKFINEDEEDTQNG